jgi:hypothetical protein
MKKPSKARSASIMDFERRVSQAERRHRRRTALAVVVVIAVIAGVVVASMYRPGGKSTTSPSPSPQPVAESAVAIPVGAVPARLRPGPAHSAELMSGESPSSALSASSARITASDGGAPGGSLEVRVDPGAKPSEVLEDVKAAMRGDAAPKAVRVNGVPLDSHVAEIALFENAQFAPRKEGAQLPRTGHLFDPTLRTQRSMFGPLKHPRLGSV